jgi:SAM-dependent methyltransferase
MSPWERFTDRSRRAVFFAQQAARQSGTHIVGAEHLLLGLITEGEESTAASLLSSLNISRDQIGSALEVSPKTLKRLSAWIQRSKKKIARDDFKLGRDGKRAIDVAMSEAQELHDEHIKTAHLLLGLIRDASGPAGRTLRNLGVELDQARNAYIQLIAIAENNEAVPMSSAVQMQEQQSKANKAAWSYRAYEHWLRFSGPPDEAAGKMRSDPASCLGRDLPYLGGVNGKRVINLLGSNGRKAIPLALLGADVTVVDISSEGARYASELAHAAGVHINYLIVDAMELPVGELANSFDLVYMEGGVFHYFSDLSGLAQTIQAILVPGGRMVATDFHPIRKCVSISEGHAMVEGNYFDERLQEGDVAYQRFFPEEEQSDFPKCQLRYWTLGEIVTAFAAAGLVVEQLVECPNPELTDIPGLFTLTATKAVASAGL